MYIVFGFPFKYNASGYSRMDANRCVKSIDASYVSSAKSIIDSVPLAKHTCTNLVYNIIIFVSGCWMDDAAASFRDGREKK